MMNSDPVDILIHYPLNEAQLARLAGISPRLRLDAPGPVDFGSMPADMLQRAQVLLTTKSLPQPERAPALCWVQFAYAGVEVILGHPLLERKGLQVTTLSGAVAPKVAEYAVMAMLALCHKLPLMLKHQHEKLWPTDRWDRFVPRELRGSTVGLLGYGSIAREIARLLQPFQVQILATKKDMLTLADTGYTPEGTGDPQGQLFTRLYPPQAMRSMLKLCDFVVVCLPLTDETVGVVDAAALDAMKPDAYLVGLGRGGQVDEEALAEALRQKKIAGAVLDVFTQEPLGPEHPLWDVENLVITPHIAGDTLHYEELVADLFAKNLQRYLAGEPLLNLVDPAKGY